jgi:hypothetical protein
MDLRKALLAEHSKKQADKIVAYVGGSQNRFDDLMTLFLSNEYRVVQRAAWPMSYCVIAHPELVAKHIKKLMKALGDNKAHSAVRRNVMRLLPHVNVPEKYHGELIDKCIQFIVTPDEKAAVKAFALMSLEKYAKEYPDIVREVELIILDQWDREAPSFHSRAKKFLKSVKSPLHENKR